MKIESSLISLAASHQFSARSETRETVRAQVAVPPVDRGNAADGASVTISNAAQLAAQADSSEHASAADAIDPQDEQLTMDPSMRLVKLVIEMLTGRSIKTISMVDLNARGNAPPPQQAQEGTGDFSLIYHRREVHEETETTAFSASGVIRTADGKEVSFDLSLTMARSYRETHEETVLFGNVTPARTSKDPLVLNFDGKAAQLHSTRVMFDLDGNGRQDEIPLLAGNRGYLALDLNGNGQVDSGKELFGPISGDGFADLVHYDADGNGWIDENDSVFDALRVWTQAEEGNGTLETLKEKGVGAIYLGRTTTPFALNDAGNNALGMVRTSGVYLSEDGRVGSVQQIDLMV